MEQYYGGIEREPLPELEELTDGDHRHGSAWVRLDPERERDRAAVRRLLDAIPNVWHLMTTTQRRESLRLQRALFDGFTAGELRLDLPDIPGPPGLS